MTSIDTARVPAAAAWLGGLGAIPFVALAVSLIVLPNPAKPIASVALAAYGALILSFLGGIQWGLAIAEQDRATTLARRLTLSVVPSLVAWGALLLPARPGLALLAGAILAELWLDLRATRQGEAPPWYPALRWPLSCAASLALGAGAFL